DASTRWTLHNLEASRRFARRAALNPYTLASRMPRSQRRLAAGLGIRIEARNRIQTPQPAVRCVNRGQLFDADASKFLGDATSDRVWGTPAARGRTGGPGRGLHTRRREHLPSADHD